MKTYEAIYKPGKTKGVFGISLVENPAMEGRFLALSEEETEIRFNTVNEEERILIGLVMEPNKPIYRKQDGEEFNVIFSDETIKELAYAFQKEGFQKNSSVEHSKKIAGVTVVESWIIENSEQDKAAALGLSHPKGSWMATMKIDNDEVWNNYVKTGNVKGFSVDALVSLRELNLKSNISMSENKGIADAIKEGFEKAISFFKTEQKIDLGSVKTSNDDVDIQFDGNTLEVGGRVWILSEEGAQVPLPIGEYPIEDNKILVVLEEGKVGELKDVAAPEQPAPEAQPATMSAKETAEVAESVANAIKSIMIKYSAEQDQKLNELKEDFNKKFLELSAQPAARPTRAIPTQAAPANTAKGRILAEIQNV